MRWPASKATPDPAAPTTPKYQVFRPEQPMFRFPIGLGNICVGEISELGDGVRDLELGQNVFRHGTFREEHVWPVEGVWVLPDGVSWKAAVCLDPADLALGAVHDGHVRIGDAVAVFGMGAIGLFAVQFARLAGAYPVIAVDPLEIRREAAVACGADLVLDPSACDVGLEIKKATGKRGADFVSSTAGVTWHCKRPCGG